MANFDGTPLVGALTNDPLSPDIKTQQAHYYRVDDGSISGGKFIHTDSVYNALMNAASAMEARLKESLENYQEHPDIQANLPSRRTSSSCSTTCSSGTSRSPR